MSSKFRHLRLGSQKGCLDGGLNVCDSPHLLDASQSSSLENVWFFEGALRKRPGTVIGDSIGIGSPVQTFFRDGDSRILMQADSHLYAYDLATAVLTDFYTLIVPAGMSSAPVGSFLPYTDGCVYFINGVEFIRWNGSTVENVPAKAPVYRTYTKSDLSSPAVDSMPLNLLSSSVTVEYRLNEASVDKLYLPPEVRTDQNVTVYKNGVSLGSRSITDNYVVLSPAEDGISSVFQVVIGLKTAYIPDSSGVLGCRRAAEYGTENRVFLCGNGTNRLYCSAAFDPTYFPVDCVRAFGSGEELTGFGKLYGSLIVFRPHGIAEVQFSADSFVLRTINPHMGCDMPGSIQTLGNRLVWASKTDGVLMLVSTSREYERNVQNLSRNIDPLLLTESDANLSAAASFDWNGFYWLSVGSKIYLWDYARRPFRSSDGAVKCAWYLFSGLNAAHFWVQDGVLHFMKRDSDKDCYFDEQAMGDGTRTFRATYRTAVLDCGEAMLKKVLDSLRITVFRRVTQRFTITIRCEQLDENTSFLLPEQISCSANVAAQAKTLVRALHRRSALSFSLEFACTTTSGGMDLVDAEILWRAGATLPRL